ncbi:DUF1501 domain-containing protein [Solirubrobacter sp. CPCC 204708]|uniref:DUF1501 domain-containing protein n=1 Tax=Solirubrobacter deserti TaxID=2282478 RepID=A0ABT4RC93_9ACTN|nr:DUF1501 domain-containing protein [Solirubrobacter deserti]MBE2315509.1 DUF1501 domain-containing protein [Solirubrobacter deserti]MDA0136148.1 DUF1501 domain-containing protein [Solirubrobacter deserti]
MERQRCIECEEIELARVRDQPPSQTMPVPYQALDGFPAGRTPRDLTRRRLLQWGIAGSASIYGAHQLGWDQIWDSVANANEAENEKCLVLIYLAGGNDGLNVMIPTEAADYAAYVAARPEIHRAQGVTPANGRVGSTPLAGPGGGALAFANVVVSKNGGGDNGQARFNFAAGGDGYGLDTLYGDGTGGPGSDLAVLPAVDAKQYSLSHFDNSDIWFAASNDQNTKTGWLGRWIDRNGKPDNPLQAVSIDTALSKAIRTERNPVCAVPSLSMSGFTNNPGGAVGGGSSDLNGVISQLAGIQAGAGNAYLQRSRYTYGLAHTTYMKVKSLTTTPSPTPTPTATPVPIAYPNTGTLSARLKTAATLLAANLGTRVITIHWGGFDTHTGQLASQDRQMAEFSRALAAFRADLQARGIEQRVATLVFSEFGRRVRENGSGTEAGTDHGIGGLMFAMGSGVRGGFAADWPGCELRELQPVNSATQGNLQVATDYRSVYKAVLDEWLGEQNSQSLLGGPVVEDLRRGDQLTGRRLFK